MPGLRRFLAGALLASSFAACDGDVLVGEFVPPPASNGGSGGTTSTGQVTTTSNGGSAGASECVPHTCGSGQPYDCGDCLDNDGDLRIDSDDPDCLGPCHNSEEMYYGNIPGQNGGNCERDCYFDNDSGAGNDGCRADHQCDPLEPSPEECPYDPDASVGSPPTNCDEAFGPASEQCLEECLPLVPNGCDCFGCCNIPGVDYPVWLGSETNNMPTCDRGHANDPEMCRPCTQDPTCFNPCEECELCVGKPDLPSSCGGGGEMPQTCAPLVEGCGLTGQSDCGVDYYCITGCCILTIK